MKLTLIGIAMACAAASAMPAMAAPYPSGVKVQCTKDGVRVTTSLMEIYCGQRFGTWDVEWPGGQAIRGVSCEAKLSDGIVLRAMDYPQHLCAAGDVSSVQDAFGRGVVLTVHHRSPGKPELRQRLWVYEHEPYLFTDLEVLNDTPISTNDISPFVVVSGGYAGAGLVLNTIEKPRTLFVPFDNDMWVRYNSDYASNSYEVTAVYDNASRHGFVLGSVTHDVWKTGIEMASSQGGMLGRLRAYGGATGLWTHDSLPHGMVTGRNILSQRLFVGYFPDWRDGLETYGQANARISPPLPWTGGVPFGWNSWAAYGFGINHDRYLKVADFFKTRLQPRGFQNDGTVYINLDSGWNVMSEAQLMEAVRHIHANGQKAGIYWTPFTYWSDDLTHLVEGAAGGVTFRDILLKDPAGNPLPKLDGGRPIDPTHPATLQWIDYNLGRFVRWGFDFVKLDFLNCGSLEGAHHDPQVTTGIAAYNVGMRRIVADLDPKKIGRPFFISLSIAPLFPGGYAHSRRISCDAAGTLSNSEYMLNSLTYGWWTEGALYRFNDPDHTVLSAGEVEGRTRLNASVITGTVLLDSDPLAEEPARARAEEFLTNPEINDLARSGRTFRPVEGDTGPHAADVYVRQDPQGVFYMAVFNFEGNKAATRQLELARLGLQPHSIYQAKDLWTKDVTQVQGVWNISLAPAESRIYRVTAR